MTEALGSTLNAEDLVAGYGELEILHGVSLVAKPGEIVAVIGPNGSGKSTLMKVLAGLLRPRSGAIRLGERDVTAQRPSARLQSGIAYVPQVRGVFANMTVLENLQMGTYLRPAREAAALERVYELFPALRERRKTNAGQLSGGQQQMVAIARALMAEPRILLLDEPSGGLAPKIVDEVFAQLQRIAAGGVAIVVVEQNARKALTLASRAYVLASGSTKLEGRGSELLADPEVNAIYLGVDAQQAAGMPKPPVRPSAPG